MRIPDYELADMHIHVMPEVDDGSESMEMTMEMLRIARENRIGTIQAFSMSFGASLGFAFRASFGN